MPPIATIAPHIVTPARTLHTVLSVIYTTTNAPLTSIPFTSNSQAFNSNTSRRRGILINGNAFYQKPSGAPHRYQNENSVRNKRNKEIDAKRKGEFLIDCVPLNADKSRTRGNMRCEMKRFEWGTDLNIKDWINQIKTYFSIGQIPANAFVGCMLMKIVPKLLNEIKRDQTLDYLAFWKKLVEVC